MIILIVLIICGGVAGRFAGHLVSTKLSPDAPVSKPVSVVLGAFAGAGVWFVVLNMLVRLAGAGG